MASALFAVSLVCLLSGRSARASDVNATWTDRQEETFVSAKVGEDVTLSCSYEEDRVQYLYWFKETPGQNPRLVSSFTDIKSDAIFHDEFKDNLRFTLGTKDERFPLKIKSVELSDSTTYLCLRLFYGKVAMESFLVHVRGSALNIRALLHQSASECLQPGGLFNLSCQVPAVVQDHRHAGNYTCSVVSCGHGGNRSLDFGDMAAVALAVVLVAVLAVLACVILKRRLCNNNEPRTGFPAPSTTHDEEPQNDESVHYAALKKLDVRKSRRPRPNDDNECVYSGVNL